MKKKFMNLLKDESGATMIEYGLLAALVAVAVITVVTTMGGTLKSTFEKINKGIAGSSANTSVK